MQHNALSYRHPECKPQGNRKFGPRRRAAIRLRELIAIARCRHGLGIQIDHRNWLFVACHTLAPLREREGGLDLEHLRDFMRQCQMIADDDDAVVTIHKVCHFRAQHARGLRARTAGRLLGLTEKERQYCREKLGRPITTMLAIDTTAAERKSVRDARERERKRRARAAAGMTPRAQYEATSLSRTSPWHAFGISRAEWYRRRKALPSDSHSREA
jgi:hypothetical protein